MENRSRDVRRRCRIVLVGIAVLIFINFRGYMVHGPAFGWSLWIFVKLCAGPFWPGRAYYNPSEIGVFNGFEPTVMNERIAGVILGMLIIAAQYLYVYVGGRILYFLSVFGLLMWLVTSILATLGSP